MERPTLFFEQEESRSELFSLTRATLEITLANMLVCLINRQTHTQTAINTHAHQEIGKCLGLLSHLNTDPTPHQDMTVRPTPSLK